MALNKTEQLILKKLEELYVGRMQMEANYINKTRYNTTDEKANAKYLANQQDFIIAINTLEGFIMSEDFYKIRKKVNYNIIDLNP